MLTDEQIARLVAMPKRVTKAPRSARLKGKHIERDFSIDGDDGTHFVLYTRQSTVLADAFSCGLRWVNPAGEDVTLVRYNGPSHVHNNRIGGERLSMVPHIHRARAEYADRGLTIDGHAIASCEYDCLESAILLLVRECHIVGLPTEHAQGELFNGRNRG